MTAECPYTWQWDALPPQNGPFPGDLDPYVIRGSPGPTRVLNPNGISIDSAVFAGLSSVTDRQINRQTDRQTTLLGVFRGNNRPHQRIILRCRLIITSGQSNLT